MLALSRAEVAAARRRPAAARGGGDAPRPRSDRRAPCRCRASRRSRSAPASSCALRQRLARSAPAGPARWARRARVEWPSWLTAEPRITASTRSPSATASARRLSTTTPQPSPRPNPSALASKVLQRPSGAMKPTLDIDDHQLGRDHQRHAAGQGDVALAAAQALARQVDRHQRRRAGGVDRQARPAQVEEVRQPVGQHAVQRAGQRARVDRLEDRRTAAARSRCGSWRRTRRCGCRASRSRGKPGVVERLDRHLEEQPLLRVHALGFARQDAEVAGVEAVDPAQEAALSRQCLARRRGVGVEPRVGIPAIGRHVPDGVDAIAQQLPECAGVSAPPGKRQAMPTMAMGSASSSACDWRARFARHQRQLQRREIRQRLRRLSSPAPSGRGGRAMQSPLPHR